MRLRGLPKNQQKKKSKEEVLCLHCTVYGCYALLLVLLANDIAYCEDRVLLLHYYYRLTSQTVVNDRGRSRTDAARVSALIAAVAVRGAIAGLSLAPMRSKIADLQARIAECRDASLYICGSSARVH